jgi:hypothetical protein
MPYMCFGSPIETDSKFVRRDFVEILPFLSEAGAHLTASLGTLAPLLASFSRRVSAPSLSLNGCRNLLCSVFFNGEF